MSWLVFFEDFSLVLEGVLMFWEGFLAGFMGCSIYSVFCRFSVDFLAGFIGML